MSQHFLLFINLFLVKHVYGKKNLKNEGANRFKLYLISIILPF